MADGKELKPKSFRLSDETAQKFKEIADQLGSNQQDTMQLLINAYFMQEQKAVLSDYKANLEQIEGYTTAILQMYTNSLQENKDMKEAVRAEFNAQLQSKDATIQDLQSQLATAKQLKDAATEQAKAHAGENAGLKTSLEKLQAEYDTKVNDMQNSLNDKDNLNKALTDSCNDLKHKIESMRADVEQMAAVKKELDDLQHEHSTLQSISDKLQADLSDFKLKHEEIIDNMEKHKNEAVERVREQAQIDRDKAILEIEKKYQTQIEKLKADKQSEIDKYQQKYLDLLEQMTAGK